MTRPPQTAFLNQVYHQENRAFAEASSSATTYLPPVTNVQQIASLFSTQWLSQQQRTNHPGPQERASEYEKLSVNPVTFTRIGTYADRRGFNAAKAAARSKRMRATAGAPPPLFTGDRMMTRGCAMTDPVSALAPTRNDLRNRYTTVMKGDYCGPAQRTRYQDTVHSARTIPARVFSQRTPQRYRPTPRHQYSHVLILTLCIPGIHRTCWRPERSSCE